RVVYYFLSKFLSSIINNFPLASVRGIWHLAHSKFCFHKYLLEVPLAHKFNLLFLLGAFSIQKGRSAFSTLAFPLVLCVFRGERRFYIFANSIKLNINPLKLNVMKTARLNALAFLFLGFGLSTTYGQVGINTSNPEATLDVNGNVRVRTLQNNPSPTKVVTLGGNNVLNTTDVSALSVSPSPGAAGTTIRVNKTYNCSSTNYGKIIFSLYGTLECGYNEIYWSGQIVPHWYYKGFVDGDKILAGEAPATIISGTILNIKPQGTTTTTYSYPIHIIDDSQYRLSF
ncbi:hypothetical protein, partial [Riemerella anatipestifer]